MAVAEEKYIWKHNKLVFLFFIIIIISWDWYNLVLFDASSVRPHRTNDKNNANEISFVFIIIVLTKDMGEERK